MTDGLHLGFTPEELREAVDRKLQRIEAAEPRREAVVSEFVIRTEHLTRYFGRKRIVFDLNLSVPRGAVFGLLGRNGSGKTTSLRMILGLLSPSWGRSWVFGE